MRDLPSAEQRAWAAGLFDGEGCVGMWPMFNKARSRTYARVALTVCQVDRRVLDRFAALCPDRLKVRGPYKKINPKGRPAYQLGGTGIETIQFVMCLLWPWLGEVKRQQFSSVVTEFTAYSQEEKGLRRGRVGLTRQAVLAIKGSTAATCGLSVLHGVSKKQVRRIRNGTRWAGVA